MPPGVSTFANHQWDAFRNCHKVGLAVFMGIDHIREILCSASVKCDGGTIDPLLGYIDVEFAGITCYHPVEAFREDLCNVPRSCTDLNEFGVSVSLLGRSLGRQMRRKTVPAQKETLKG